MTLSRLIHSSVRRGLLLLVLMSAGIASAHTALKESTPAADTTVTVAPGELNLVFNGPVRLIKLELMGVGHEMPTSFKPAAEALASYVVETPGMHPGDFTVNWAFSHHTRSIPARIWFRLLILIPQRRRNVELFYRDFKDTDHIPTRPLSVILREIISGSMK